MRLNPLVVLQVHAANGAAGDAPEGLSLRGSDRHWKERLHHRECFAGLVDGWIVRD